MGWAFFITKAMTSKIDSQCPNTVVVFTDGSCYPNPNGDGGWAFYLTYMGKQAARYGCADVTTNNAMELVALQRALEFVPAGEKHTSPLLVITDSKYALNACTEWVHGWKQTGWRTSNGKPVSNRATMERLLALVEAHRAHRHLEIRWVRGHTGIPENELVDRSANHARKNKLTNWKPKDNKHT